MIEQPLPGLFQTILEQAQEIEDDEIAQLNKVVASLIDEVRYSGNWIDTKGRLVPRDLAEIAATKYGDCKDFTVATAAILHCLGYVVQPALINRTEKWPIWEGSPSIEAFDHVLVKAKGQRGKVYWIDPTNKTSMVQGIFPDIAGKWVLVLDEKNSSYEQIPNIDAGHAQIIQEEKVAIQGNELYKQGTISLKGEQAAPFVGFYFDLSKTKMEKMIFNYLNNGYVRKTQRKSFTFPDLNNRTVEDITYHYAYLKDNALFKTNLGSGIKFYLGKLRSTLYNIVNEADNDNNVGDHYIGYPQTYTYTTIVQNRLVENLDRLNYSLDRPWMELSIEAKHQEEDTHITVHGIVKKSFITAKELKSQAFQSFKDQVQKDFLKVILVL